ncbi:MAG: flagellar biosynthesis regulator FlaF [Paracoccaceae bacterium]
MNALNMARMAYSSTNKGAAPIRTPRGTEFDVIARITSQLKATAADPKRDYAAFVRALHENRRLWTLFATDLADSDNALPQALRAQLFYLAEFTLQHTSKILNGSATADVLIEINTSVMRGLQGERAAA